MAEAAQQEGHDHGGHGHGADEGHEKHYWKIYWILVVLFLISFIGPFVGDVLREQDMATIAQGITLTTAFGVAVAKAALVVRNFMHLTLEPRFVFYIASTAVVLMGLFFFWVAPDVMKHEGHQWVNVAALAAAGDARVVDEGPFDAQETFETVCAPCHGMQGGGDGPAAATLDPRPATFASAEFWTTRDKAHVIRTITEGGPAVGKSPLMPSFGAAYSAEQIDAIAEHVLTFRPEAPPEEAVTPEEPGEEEAVAPEEPGEEVAPAEEVAEVAPPAAPAGPSEAEQAMRARFITRRLY